MERRYNSEDVRTNLPLDAVREAEIISVSRQEPIRHALLKMKYDFIKAMFARVAALLFVAFACYFIYIAYFLPTTSQEFREKIITGLLVTLSVGVGAIIGRVIDKSSES